MLLVILPASALAKNPAATAKSSARVTLMLNGEPRTSSGRNPSRSMACASSVTVTPARAACRSASLSCA